MKSTVNKFIKTLQANQLTIALAESVTCGLASHQLTMIKGTSDVLSGGIICYQEETKCGLLGVPKNLIDKYTAESQQVTDALGKKLSRLIKADIYAAITGLADEGGSETKQKPVGTIFFSVYFKRQLHQRRKLFRGTPLEIKRKACKELYHFVIEIIAKS